MNACLACRSLNLRKVTRLQAQAEHGYCDKHERYIVILRQERECASFVAVDVAAVQQRNDWLKKIK